MAHQGADASGNAYLFRASGLACRGVFGKAQSTHLLCSGNYPANTEIKVNLYSTTDATAHFKPDKAGYPIDTLVCNFTNNVILTISPGIASPNARTKRVTIVNANTSKTVYLRTLNNVLSVIRGGSFRDYIHIESELISPTPADTTYNYCWIVSDDNP
jgi:hypothetical protein